MPDISLEIFIGDKRWKNIRSLQPRLRKAAIATFEQMPKKLQLPCSISVLLTNDATVRRLNRDFRGKDKPTNVLSFPQFTSRQLTKMGKTSEPLYAGDIALGYQYMVAEIKKDHKILINHTMHLLIHGILHIFGYDHKSGAGTLQMQKLEQRIMSGLGLPDPYAQQPKEQKAR